MLTYSDFYKDTHQKCRAGNCNQMLTEVFTEI